MKTIGLIGGTSWVSSLEYYRQINQLTNQKAGGEDFAKCILFSLNYGEIEVLKRKNDNDGIFKILLSASEKLVAAGADCFAIGANTLHSYADKLEKEIPLPFIHIASATANKIRGKGFSTVGLLGTKATMEMSFYKDKLAESGVKCIVPNEAERNFIQNTITKELIYNIFKHESRERFIQIIGELKKQGADGVVLGCTEIPLLVKQENTNTPLFDTLQIHAEALVDFAIH
jgi:aspartate racemase